MSGESHVGHEVLKAFAKNKVNVPKEEAKERRRQVNYLRERLEDYIAAHPDFDLVKLRASGSTAKHTAIRRRGAQGLTRMSPRTCASGTPTSTSRRSWPGWRSAAKRSTARRRPWRTSSLPTTRSAPCGAPGGAVSSAVPDHADRILTDPNWSALPPSWPTYMPPATTPAPCSPKQPPAAG